MEKINRVEDLPEWFDLQNYSAAESFGVLDWYKHLKERQYLFTLLDIIKENNGHSSIPAAKAFARDVVYFRGVDVAIAEIPNFFGSRGLIAHLKDERQGVHSLTFRHLLEHARNLEDYLYEPEKWFQSLHALSEEHAPEERSAADQPLTISTYLDRRNHLAVARVNLDLPDNVLMESFSIWLAEIRKERGEPTEKRYHRPNFQRWAKYGLLPYLDLKAWSEETGVHIPDRVMAAAVLPRLDFGESNLRKTVMPSAQSLMKNLSELQALAALEAEAATDGKAKVEK